MTTYTAANDDKVVIMTTLEFQYSNSKQAETGPELVWYYQYIDTVYPKNDLYHSWFVVVCYGLICVIITHILQTYITGTGAMPFNQPWRILVNWSTQSAKNGLYNHNETKHNKIHSYSVWDIYLECFDHGKG